MPDDKACEHNYLHLETIKRVKESAPTDIFYQRIDLFYCTKCLKIENQTENLVTDNYKAPPFWW